MDNQADFTLGANFKDLPDFVREEAERGVRFIPILDPAINTEKANYQTHANAMANNVYITWFNKTLQPSGNCTASPKDCQGLNDVMQGYVNKPSLNCHLLNRTFILFCINQHIFKVVIIVEILLYLLMGIAYILIY